MGLPDNKCDSCNQKVDVLFPIAILDELPSGINKLVQRWYCVICKDEIEAEAEDVEPRGDEEDEEDNRIRRYKCSCRFSLYQKDISVWKAIFLCRDHHFKENDEITYVCGCVIYKISEENSFYIYIKVCDEHV